MKISNISLTHMSEAISPLDTPERREQYRTGNFPRADRTNDVDKRYRWDLLYAAGLSGFVCDLYNSEDVNDNHVDTALRAIVPALEATS